MRRWGLALAALMLAGVGLTATPAAATAPAVDCAVSWGSLDKVSWDSDSKSLENIRTGQHDCYDRLVFDVAGSGADPIGYSARYVDELVQDGSGMTIPVGGGAILDISVFAPSYDSETGTSTYPGRAGQPLPGVDITGYRTFKDTRYASSFEGNTQIGLGVRARLPFRVFQTSNHLVVDVAHTW